MREGERDGALTVGLGRGGGSTEQAGGERVRLAASVHAGRRRGVAPRVQELVDRLRVAPAKPRRGSKGLEDSSLAAIQEPRRWLTFQFGGRN